MLTRDAEGVGPLLGEAGVLVVEVLGGRAHDERGGVDDLLGDETWVRVGARAELVPAHVLDPTRDGDVDRPDRDLGGHLGGGGEGAGAHPVDGVAGDVLRQTGQQRDGPADGESLVAGLRRRRDRDLTDPLGWQRRVAAQELADTGDDEVVSASLRVEPVLASAAERRPYAVDEHDAAAEHATGRAARLAVGGVGRGHR